MFLYFTKILCFKSEKKYINNEISHLCCCVCLQSRLNFSNAFLLVEVRAARDQPIIRFSDNGCSGSGSERQEISRLATLDSTSYNWFSVKYVFIIIILLLIIIIIIIISSSELYWKQETFYTSNSDVARSTLLSSRGRNMIHILKASDNY